MNRRFFCFGLLALTGNALAGKDYLMDSGSVRQKGGAPDELRSLAVDVFRDMQAVRGVGGWFLLGGSCSRNECEQFADSWKALSGKPRAYIRSQFIERVQEEYRSGSTVEVNGWILSRSEVCLCGAVALT